MKIDFLVRIVGVAAVLSLSMNAGTVGLWHLGEADPGAVAGNPVNVPSIDSSGNGRDLLQACSCPTYTDFTAPGSTLAASFPGGGSGLYAAVATFATDNFGMEI